MQDGNPVSLAFGLATVNSQQQIIEAYYPQPLFAPAAELVDAVSEACGLAVNNGFATLEGESLAAVLAALKAQDAADQATLLQQLAGGTQPVIACVIREDAPAESVPEAYLKLHLLSHRHVRPHEINLDGIFAVLPNNAWTTEGAIDPSDLPHRQMEARLHGRILDVMSVDKFPKMTSYVVPSGVRIAHTARVRLGAYLGEGTTVMHEGFVNFNAGTEGPAMIEGRISAGVMVGANSDLGGGCSTMGTLSGGGKEIISVGKNCLIGANAGIGIPLADDCIVEAGLYVTAGTKINVLDDKQQLQSTVKAKELIGVTGLLYRRNSLNGAVECVPLKGTVSLNEALHSHN